MTARFFHSPKPKDQSRTAMIDKSRLPARKCTLPQFTPVPRTRQRHDGWTPERQQRFIEALADKGSVKAAAHAVNMTPEGAYLLRRHPEAASFRKAWEHALSLGVQQLEDAGLERALHGQQVPVYSYGKIIGTRTVYNDRLLMFYLRNRAASRFSADQRGQSSRQNTIGDPHYAAHISKLKKQWRKEWEAEQAAASRQSSEEVVLGINAKLESMRNNWLNAMSPHTRAAYDRYKELEEQDRATGYRHPLPEPDEDEEEFP